ncbi:MAG: ABC transporter permease [Chloroflexi bacterium]|nr:ABC transporter permease [Chloroflexota bacterium]MXX50301.1 ABC transporter permease [Chloroflexota bacterium]MYA94151.1 ABC transporter permease [Chloroflexota bacterium]MYC55626.1 ABC transporter permease [Chloroflexota bacterium]MYD38208.1 ABC transporter permease [Chloroflexota bacterium]
MATEPGSAVSHLRADDTLHYQILSQRQLIWRKFRRHRVAYFCLVFLCLFYLLAIFAEFFAPYGAFTRDTNFLYAPPTPIHFVDADGVFHVRPFVYKITNELDLETFQRHYVEDKDELFFIEFFIRAEPYRLLGFIETDIHFFGVPEEAAFFLAGTDGLGRDLFSRMLLGARTSLFVGLLGLAIGFVLGLIFGGISGYYGGSADMLIQRMIEFLQSLPTLPLWMALSALVPPDWTPIQVYFGISLVLASVGWTGLARVVRGKLISLREEDYVLAAKLAGLKEHAIIMRHLLPGFLSYLIVHLTLAIPHMILGETALSFLGLGIQPPAVSLGTLLQDSQNVQTVTINPWLLYPGAVVVVIVIAFNFLGDGLRDAADPYKHI